MPGHFERPGLYLSSVFHTWLTFAAHQRPFTASNTDGRLVQPQVSRLKATTALVNTGHVLARTFDETHNGVQPRGVDVLDMSGVIRERQDHKGAIRRPQLRQYLHIRLHRRPWIRSPVD